MDKETLRKEKREILRSIPSKEERERAVTVDVLAFVRERFPYKKLRIAAYLSMNNEFSADGLIDALLDEGHKVYVPVVVGKDLVFTRYKRDTFVLPSSSYGIREPMLGGTLPPKRFDVAIVPLLAFDDKNRRLGRGKGYYDRFLTKQQTALKLGIAFQEQKTDEVPVNELDVRLDRIFYS